MRALAQGSAQIVDAIAALRAGEDVLLGTPDEAALRAAGGRARAGAAARPDRCRRRRCGEAPAGRAAPLAGTAPTSRRSTSSAAPNIRRSPPSWPDGRSPSSATTTRLLPLKPAADARIAVVQSMPADLTPADTSSTVPPTLASALRRRLPGVEEILLPAAPGEAEIAGARASGSQASTSSSSGRSPRTSSRRRRRWPRRSWRPASRPSPSPCARRGTCSRTRPPGPTSAATASCRRRWRRWRPRCSARRRSSAGCPSTSPGCIHAVTDST